MLVCRSADNGSGIPGPGRCAHPPSVRRGLRHAAQLGFTHSILARSSKAQRLFDLVRGQGMAEGRSASICADISHSTAVN